MTLSPRKINPEVPLETTPEWLNNVFTKIKEKLAQLLWISQNIHQKNTEVDKENIDECLRQIVANEQYIKQHKDESSQCIINIREKHISELIEMLTWYQEDLNNLLKAKNTQHQIPIQYLTLYYIESLINILKIQQELHSSEKVESQVKTKSKIEQILRKYQNNSQGILKTIKNWNSSSEEIQKLYDKNTKDLKTYIKGIGVVQDLEYKRL